MTAMRGNAARVVFVYASNVKVAAISPPFGHALAVSRSLHTPQRFCESANKVFISLPSFFFDR
jgi:hypothetical protein